IQQTPEAPSEIPVFTTSNPPEFKQEPSASHAALRPKSEPVSQPTYQAIPTLSSPTSYSTTPQQIPTYQQPQPSDLKADRPERSIRPSEMKDEG
ncbi:hypothetical protein SCLCIDRAFT_118515, partial [Scleroderma citrinum Foug A]